VTANLPTDLLRNFVAIVESGSMAQACERVCVTQSALSLQMKRLTEIVRAPIFLRHRRGLLLTPAGEELLVFARGILDLNDRAIASIGQDVHTGPARLGLSQDFATPILSGVLVRFMRQHPEVRLQVRVSTTMTLNAEFAAGLHDIMVGIGSPEEADVVGAAQMVWCGDRRLADAAEIPLAIMETPCLFRDAALSALTSGGRALRIVLETPSVAVLRAAVEGGLAVTCRTESFMPGPQGGFEIAGAPLPRVGFVIRDNVAANPLILRLSALIRRTMAELEVDLHPPKA
jgi:DNA-binding transcriptional LysR family regulator